MPKGIVAVVGSPNVGKSTIFNRMIGERHAIVDDEAGIRDLLSEILQEEGYRTITAESVAEAMKIRQNMTPDLVLLDVWLPDGDGISLLKEWVNLSLLTMPVIVMSGHASVDTAVEATKIGALDFLEKPISLQ